jgi:hypothetical protein
MKYEAPVNKEGKCSQYERGVYGAEFMASKTNMRKRPQEFYAQQCR